MRHVPLIAVWLAGAAFAQEPAEDPATPPTPRLVLPVSLLDVPAATALGYHWPTGEQALEVNKLALEGGHALLHWGFRSLSERWWSVTLEMVATTAFDVFSRELPGGDGWLHEEGHRAAMFASGVPSRQVFLNWAYRPEERCDEGSVCGMTDEQIAGVKARRSADWVRVQAAGIEYELEQIRRLEKDALFYDQPAYQNIPFHALYQVSVLAYRAICAAPGYVTEAGLLAESRKVENRDFTGPDCNGWAYDLFRPDEPYAARGEHPLGGVRRTRLYEQMHPEEQKYLRTMRNLGFLNLVDSNLIGFAGFEVSLAGRPARVNATLGHHLTSFGDGLFVNLFARREQLKLYGELMLFRNHTGHFPGLRLELVRHPVPSFRTLYLSASAWAWVQPKDQSFYDNTARPGGALDVSLSVPLLKRLEAFAAVGGKTEGWVVAKPSLYAGVDARAGATLVF